MVMPPPPSVFLSVEVQGTGQVNVDQVRAKSDPTLWFIQSAVSRSKRISWGEQQEEKEE